MVKNTACFASVPITFQAGLRVCKLALHSNRSYGYAFRSRAALSNTNPAPAPVILVRNAGQRRSQQLCAEKTLNKFNVFSAKNLRLQPN
jgi:hypothetical protein